MPDWREQIGSSAPADVTGTRSARDIFMEASLNAPSQRLGPGKKNKDDWRFLDSMGIDPYRSQAVNDVTLDQMLMAQGGAQLLRSAAGMVTSAARRITPEVAAGALEKQKGVLASSRVTAPGQGELFPSPAVITRPPLPSMEDILPVMKTAQERAMDYMLPIYGSPEMKERMSEMLVGMGKKYNIGTASKNASLGPGMANIVRYRLGKIMGDITVDPSLQEGIAAQFGVHERKILVNPLEVAKEYVQFGKGVAEQVTARDIVHESTHALDSLIPETLTKRIGPAYSNLMEEEVRRLASNPAKFEGVSLNLQGDDLLNYLNDPNEIYARLGEIRYQIGSKVGASPEAHIFNTTESMKALENYPNSGVLASDLKYLYHRAGGVEGLRKLARLLPAAAPFTALQQEGNQP